MNPSFLTPEDSYHRIHTYFTGSPYHPDNQRLLYTRFETLQGPAHVCVLDTATGEESIIGEAEDVWYHSGSRAWFAQSGKGIIYQNRFSWNGGPADDARYDVVYHDLKTGEQLHYASSICNYSLNIGDRFIESDGDCAPEEQADMGIYLRSNDGTQRTRLANVKQLLELNPHGTSIHGSQLKLRLGGAIRPDGNKVMLFLVSRIGILVRDYYLCNPDGSDLKFLGRLGTHLAWHPDNRHVLVCAGPNGCSYFPQLRGKDSEPQGARLASYDTLTHTMTLLSDIPLRGGCHPAPSPDGTKVVVDSIREGEIDLLLYDYASGKLETLLTQPYDTRVELPRDSRLDLPNGTKHYNVHPHPSWSHDSRKIIFNACPERRVRPCQITL